MGRNRLTELAPWGKRGIVVELVLFCAIYDDKLWDVNPMKARNNLQGRGNVTRQEVYALRDSDLTAAQEDLVRWRYGSERSVPSS